ncbi:MAG TPA: S41 family peptidase [Bacteroidia bacterium]|jgi:carboxyl-terminal processing protease|nr:S41 family peptidase [Bacteroidia bacterium]
MKAILKKFKLAIIAAVIGGYAIISYSFVDNYFEVSKNLDIFATLFRELNIYYVDETNPGDLMKKGIDDMLESLDPYTNYIPESEIEDYRYMTTGQYGGIGALIRQQGEYVVVSEPYEGFPAQKADLRAGDRIIKINDIDTKGKKTEDISKFLKGQASTTIKLLIEREGEKKPLEKVISREEIKIKSVSYSGMITKNIGYIKLTGFTENAANEVKDALIELKKNPDLKSIVFDLRGNPGGLLKEAVDIVNIFVEKGTDVVSTRGKVKDWDKVHKALNVPVDLNIPIAVLVDRGSASASEIVSGSLQDLDRGVVVGQRSYGKGLVQQTRPLSYNAQLKITVAKYYTPSGRCIQALDYSHRNEDGSVAKVPDSLITAFKTKNGRIVYDGGGVAPDVKVETQKYSAIVASLVTKNLIFDYATKYRNAHPTIIAAKDFKLTDKEYDEFVEYLNGKDYDYTTKTEKTIEELKADAKDDKNFEAISADIEALKSKIIHNKKEDLIKYSAEIKQFLEEEIASRYYFQNGRLEASFKDDKELKESIALLNDQELYKKILTTIIKANKPFNTDKEKQKNLRTYKDNDEEN